MLQEQNHGEKSEDQFIESKTILIALGSNIRLGDVSLAATFGRAFSELETRGAVIRAVSPYYHTPAFPEGSGPDFLNAAAALDAPWSAAETLQHLHAVEAQMGRERVERWGQRTLDLDLIAMDDTVLPDAETHQEWRDMSIEDQIGRAPEELIVPHPRLQDRGFVLVPLADIAPDWRHPLLGKTVAEMLDDLPETLKSEVRLAQ